MIHNKGQLYTKMFSNALGTRIRQKKIEKLPFGCWFSPKPGVTTHLPSAPHSVSCCTAVAGGR